jgi:Contractile injection system tube protein/LysM domain
MDLMAAAKPKAQKAYLETESGAKLPCLFNPAELAITLSNQWDADPKPGQQTPTLQYKGGDSGKLKLDLFFDTTDTGKTVTEYTDKLFKLMAIDKKLPGYSKKKQNGRPSWVKFHWGKFHSFKCIIDSLAVTFVHFGSDGTPLRAKVGIELVQYTQEDSWPRQNPTSGTPTPAASHVLQRGETLDRLASRYYGDPFHWRPIADANGITDPFALRPGRIIDIPQLEA